MTTATLDLDGRRKAITIEAYERLASEYDAAAHETTRSLERASLKAIAQAASSVESRPPTRIVELGSGTGSATAALAALGASAIECTDPSQRMLAIARSRPPAEAQASWRQATAMEALAEAELGPGDLVAATLADPFLDATLVRRLHDALPVEGRAVLTVPTASWAAKERTERLHLPLDQTSFRLADGSTVTACSHVYDLDELLGLIASVGAFRVEGCGTERGHHVPQSPAVPEVAWALIERGASG